MATANFQARIERIQNAQNNAPMTKKASFRTPGIGGVAAVMQTKRRRRHPVRDHITSIALGLVIGGLLGVLLMGLSMEGAPWGPAGQFHTIAYYATMGGLGLAPLLVFLSVIMATKRPGFALFTLAYVTGIAAPMMF